MVYSLGNEDPLNDVILDRLYTVSISFVTLATNKILCCYQFCLFHVTVCNLLVVESSDIVLCGQTYGKSMSETLENCYRLKRAREIPIIPKTKNRSCSISLLFQLHENITWNGLKFCYQIFYQLLPTHPPILNKR